jgi:hypothetical protein
MVTSVCFGLINILYQLTNFRDSMKTMLTEALNHTRTAVLAAFSSEMVFLK